MKNTLKWTFIYFLIGVALIFFINYMQKENVTYLSYSVMDSVDLLYHGEEMKGVDLNEYRFSKMKKGDELELSFRIEDVDIEQPMIAFLTYHCNVRAYDNGELVYEYGWNSEKEKRMGPSGIYIIPLQNTDTHEVRIFLTILENNAFTSIDMLELHESSTFFKEYFRKNVLNFTIGVFMVTLGAVVLVILLFVGKLSRQYRKALWLAGFCILAGLWLECDTYLMQFYIGDLYLVSELKYFSLYSCMIPLLMFCQETFRSEKKKKMIKSCAVITTVVCAIVTLQHVMGWVSFAANLTLYQIMTVIFVAIVFGAAILECRGEENSERIFCHGVCFLCCCICIELLRFNVSKYWFPDVAFLKISVVYFGFLFFIMIMQRSYFVSLLEYISELQKQEVMEKMSSEDMLTDLSTRIQCNKKIENLRKRGQKKFSVILFDLNYLKHINERFGHEMGDAYIYEFAQILKRSFSHCFLLGRMGSDEFMAVLEGKDVEKEKEYLHNVETFTQEYNVDKDKVIRISYAVGSASSMEGDSMDFWKVYELADDRMLECKKRVKANK